MGCGASREGGPSKEEGTRHRDVKLKSCKLKFSQQNLSRLNRKFADLLESKSLLENEKEKRTAYVGVVVERLIQRLVCNVGELDARFSSKFLVNLEPLKNYKCRPGKVLKYKYLVRLDLLSSPALYPQNYRPSVKIIEGYDDESLPQGFAKIRVQGESLEQWMDFINGNGFLRRDKIQGRFVELLAKAAAKPSGFLAPKDVDESKHCGSPGKVVDPITLCHILRTPPSHQFFFGSAECNESRFPDPRDFRIAIVEGVPEIRLHISFLSPAAQSISSEDVEISIVLGIGVSGWPSGSNFPFRLPLDHVDFILGYKAAQYDYYLVPKGPHSSVYCEDRSSVWEIRTPATEMFLLHHYSPTSVVWRVYKALLYLLEILKARGVKTITRYILKNLLFFELEQKKSMQHWAPKAISKRLISIFDQLLMCLRCQNIPSYIFTDKNLFFQEDSLEDDFTSDGDILEYYLKLLSNEDNFKHEDDRSMLIRDQMENVMLQKWENVVLSMSPPVSNRNIRLSVLNNSLASISYTRPQVEYVAMLIQEILRMKKIQKPTELGKPEAEKQADDSEDGLRSREDFIYLLQIMFEQAKQKLLTSKSVYPSSRSKGDGREMSKLDQLVLSYDISTAMIVDDLRRTEEIDFTFPDEVSIVVGVLRCLYKAIDSDGRVLRPFLRPYLDQLFKGSHENCWFLNEWKKKMELSEVRAMEMFADLVLSGKIDPLNGILKMASKGWDWAKSCLQIIHTVTNENSTKLIVGDKIDSTQSGLRLIFTPEPAKTIAFNVSTTKVGRKDITSGTAEDKSGSDSRYATIKSFQDVLDAATSTENSDKGNPTVNKGLPPLTEKQPPHVLLKNGNPFTVASMDVRRQGNHRGLGSIVQALISLQKLTVLQEISQYLPAEERTKVLSDITKLSKEVQRLAVENYKKKSFASGLERNRFSFRKSQAARETKKASEILRPNRGPRKTTQPQEIYRSLSEFTVTNQTEEEKDVRINKKKVGKERNPGKEDDLLETCRLLRKNSRPTLFDMNTLHTFPKPGRHKRGSGSLTRYTLNTPFYIKVSPLGSKMGRETTEF